MHALLSYNTLFIRQLYEDKSLTLCACDLIFFTTGLQTANYYTTIDRQSLSFFLNRDIGAHFLHQLNMYKASAAFGYSCSHSHGYNSS